MEMKPVVLVLVDISGYTQFLKYHATSVLHAEEIIVQLLEAVIDRAKHPLVLNKLEGDAAFLYAVMQGDEEMIARDIVNQLLAFFMSFNTKANELACKTMKCVCEACRNVADLKLKAIMHSGDVAFKYLRQFEELGGENAIIPHRLLKNTIPAHEYIVMTEEFHKLAGDMDGMASEWRTESYEDIGEFKIKVFYPQRETLPVQEAPGWMHIAMIFRFWVRAFRNTIGLDSKKKFSHLPGKKTTLGLYLSDNIRFLIGYFRGNR